MEISIEDATSSHLDDSYHTDDRHFDYYSTVNYNSTCSSTESDEDIDCNRNDETDFISKVTLVVCCILFKICIGNISEAMREIESSDFSPFPNKVYALLYLLMNNPRPLVSNIKFICFNGIAKGRTQCKIYFIYLVSMWH